MNTTINLDLLDDPATKEADAQAVQRSVETGVPVAPEVFARVRARSDRARDETFRRMGSIDIQPLLRPSVDDS